MRMTRRLRVLLLVLLASVCLSTYLWFRLIPPRPAILLMMEKGPQGGIDAEQQIGIMTLFQDALEQDPDCTVLTEIPTDTPAAFRRQMVRLAMARRGSNLVLDALITSPEGRTSTLHHEGSPFQVFSQVSQDLRFDPSHLNRLVPREPEAFWELAKLSGPIQFEELPQRKARALKLAERLPECVTAQYRAAYLSLRMLIVEASNDPSSVHQVQEHFDRTLALLPHYPRAVYQLVRFKTDIGAFPEALDLALAHKRHYPRHPLAHGALCYVTRNAGMLEAAQRALRNREILSGGSAADPGLGENTYLYAGYLDRFERTLMTTSQAPTSPLRLFYRGYTRLLREDRPGALAFFRQAQERPGSVTQFEQLSRVFELAMTEQPTQALDLLQTLWKQRVSLRVPDGEFTFKLAEAFAFLGQEEAAMDAAARAFSHGFWCTRWYRNSPLLASLQDNPRWQSLLNHIQTRQSALAAKYPLELF